ncbi:MAG TPA: DUF11 domain-containing protein [Vicinamibacteria bacterium]|nr:DUF11 domain-containing protein [Vicinamibacteria bacterium]
MRMRAALAFGLLVAGATSLQAQPYDLRWWTADDGGAMGQAAGPYVLDATAGQPDAGGPSVAGPYVVHTGFWALTASGGIGPQADLSVTVTDGTTTAVPGQSVTYAIVASNAGPSAVTGAVVADTPPGALTGLSWTCTASAGSSCAASGTGPLGESVNLLSGGSATFLLTATVDPSATGTLVNTATVSAPAGVLDPSLANNVGTDTDTLTPVADLGIAISDAPDPVAAGGGLTYTLQVTNAGPSTSPGMTLTDTLPAAVTFVSSAPGSPTCTQAAGVVSCALASLTPAATTAVTLQVQVATGAAGLLSNGAAVDGTASDPNAANDSDIETTQVLSFRPRAELAHGTRLRADLASVGGQPDQDLYRIRQQPHASYEVVLDGASGDLGSGHGPSLERVAADGSTVLQSSEAVGVGPSRSLRFMNTSATAMDGELVRVRSASCVSGCGVDDVYLLRAWETSTRVPRFNNSATQVSVLVLHNRTTRTVRGRLYFWNGAGALLREEPVTLAPRGSASLNTSLVPGLAFESGSITLAHDGPYAAVGGKVVSLEPGTGLSSDSMMESIPR